MNVFLHLRRLLEGPSIKSVDLMHKKRAVARGYDPFSWMSLIIVPDVRIPVDRRAVDEVVGVAIQDGVPYADAGDASSVPVPRGE